MGRRTWLFPLAIAACAMLAIEARADDWVACAKVKSDVSISNCSNIIEAGTESAENLAIAHYNRGTAYSNKGDYDRAIADYGKAIALDPKFADAYNNRGIVYKAKGDFARAIADYGKAIALNPKDVKAYYNRGILYAEKGDRDRAIADYTKAIALEPKDADVYNNRGNAYASAGDYNRAIADQNKAIALDPKHANARYNRGRAYHDKGDFDRAIADYSKAIALKPKGVDAYGNRGRAYEEQGKKQKAAADFRKAIALRPGDRVGTAGLKRLSGSIETAAASATAVGFKQFANTDFAGALLEKTPAASAADCEVKCQANSECAAFTFNVWNAACFLKSGVTAALLEPSSVSGLPAGAAPPPKSTAAKSMVRYRGRVFPGEPSSAGASASFVTCEARCEDDPHCVAFSYVKETSICRQFARAGEYSKDSGIDSGVKRQVGQ